MTCTDYRGLSGYTRWGLPPRQVAKTLAIGPTPTVDIGPFSPRRNCWQTSQPGCPNWSSVLRRRAALQVDQPTQEASAVAEQRAPTTSSGDAEKTHAMAAVIEFGTEAKSLGRRCRI